MIVSFSVSNFRSFSSEETFSLVAAHGLASSHEDHCVPIPDSQEKVLHTAVLYGANGAGKSNLFKAIKYLADMILGRSNRDVGTGTRREAFRLGGKAGEPTSFDLQFIANARLYRFGLKVDDQRIAEEWLVRVEGDKEIPLYERITDEQGKVTVEGPKLREISEKLAALATVGGPRNQLFLATIRNTLDNAEVGDELRSILKWFQRDLQLIGPDDSVAPLGHLALENPQFLDFAGDFLRSSSTGVDRLNPLKKELTEEEFRALLSERVISKLLEDSQKDSARAAILSIDGATEFVVEVKRAGENHFYRITIQAAHEHENGTAISFDLTDESDGTRRLLSLLPALYRLQGNSGVYIIDEIDRSMHPMLARRFLEFFLQSCKGACRQVIVTTHESNLLDLDLLRRDEIWFAEKDSGGATRLYSLADFKVRSDPEIRKHYLQGRFGAIPFLGDLNRLLAPADCEK